MPVSEQQCSAAVRNKPLGEQQRQAGIRGRHSGRQRARQGGTIAAQPWQDNVFTQPARRRYSPYALALTLFIHLAPLLLILLAPELLVPEEAKAQKPKTKVELVPPPFVQVNPFANQERVRTEQEGAQNQRAAQEAAPDPNSRAEGPQLEGEDPRFKRIISGNPEAPDIAPAPLSATGDSDSVTPPAAGSAGSRAGGGIQLQTRAEYLRAQAATAQPQSVTPQTNAQGQPHSQQAGTQGQTQTGTQALADKATDSGAQQQTAEPRQTVATEALSTPATAQQAPSPLRPQTATGAQQPRGEDQSAAVTAKPPEQLSEEGMAPADLPTDELAPPAPAQGQATAAQTQGQPTPAEPAQAAESTAQPAAQPAESTQPLEQPQSAEPAQSLAQLQPAEPAIPTEPAVPLPVPQPVQVPEATPLPAEATQPPQPSAETTQDMPLPAATPAQGSEDSPAIDPSAPRPRPTLEPRISAGPLRHQSVMANQRGLVAIDSRFSEFGAYQERMIEAISQQWYLLARQSKAIDSEYGTQVVLVFTMDDHGIISNTQVRFTNASAAATLLCINAVESRSPFGFWTADMKRVLGESQTVTFTFYYR